MKIESNEIRVVPIDSIKPNPRNPNRHSIDQIKRLSKIIMYSGFRQPLVVSNLSGFLISGHGRLEAAKSLGMKEVPVIYEDFEDEAMEFQHLTADNSIASWAELDLGKINTDFLQFGPDFDIDLLGIKDFVLEPADKDKEAQEDDVPEATQSISKLGDLYELGEHRLLCGDSTDKATVEMLMDGEKADICFTSPPYNVGNNGTMNGHNVGKKYLKTSDDKTNEDYLGFLKSNLDLCLSFADEVFYNIQFLGANKLVLVDLLSSYKASLKDLIYWVKDNASPHIEPGIMASYVEWIICLSSGNNTKKFHKTAAPRGSLKNVIRGPGNGQNEYSKIHSATFPVYLAETVITGMSQSEMSVLDTFGGSGTTLIACEKTKRKCFMMELDPHYIDVIVSRYVKYSGNKSIKRNGEPMEWPA